MSKAFKKTENENKMNQPVAGGTDGIYERIKITCTEWQNSVGDQEASRDR